MSLALLGVKGLIAVYIVVYIKGNVTRASTETFGACNYTDFVAEAVGICEKRFYMDLAKDLSADCR